MGQLTGNLTLNLPTNYVNGGIYYVVVRQDATGGRTVSFNASYKVKAGAAVSTTANSYSIIMIMTPATGVFLLDVIGGF